MALLDTASGSLEFVTGDWLREFGAGFDPEEHFSALGR
jgi:hypothetical protein